MDLGEALKILRGKTSLRDAAEMAGISHTYLDRLEKGIDPRTGKDISPSPTVLKSIALAYKVPYETLMALAGYLDISEDVSDPNLNNLLKELNSINKRSDYKDELLKFALVQQENNYEQYLISKPSSDEAGIQRDFESYKKIKSNSNNFMEDSHLSTMEKQRIVNMLKALSVDNNLSNLFSELNKLSPEQRYQVEQFIRFLRHQSSDTEFSESPYPDRAAKEDSINEYDYDVESIAAHFEEEYGVDDPELAKHVSNLIKNALADYDRSKKK